MMELFQESMRAVNLPFTVLAMLAVLYWVVVLLGVIDVDALDFDMDLDVDVDVDVDVDGDIVGHGSALASLVGILGLKNVPILLALSVYFISLWLVGMVAQYYLNPGDSAIIGGVIIAVNLFASLIVMRIVTRPFAKIYGVLNKDYDAPAKVVGSVCTVTSLDISGSRVGSCEILAKGAPIQINAVHRGEHFLKKGDEALVVRYDKENRVYEIEPINLEV